MRTLRVACFRRKWRAILMVLLALAGCTSASTNSYISRPGIGITTEVKPVAGLQIDLDWFPLGYTEGYGCSEGWYRNGESERKYVEKHAQEVALEDALSKKQADTLLAPRFEVSTTVYWNEAGLDRVKSCVKVRGQAIRFIKKGTPQPCASSSETLLPPESKDVK